MSWPELVLAWLAGFVAIQIVTRLMLRGEPTAHGQIVGRWLGFWIGLLWPIALPWLAIVGTGRGLARIVKRLRGAA